MVTHFAWAASRAVRVNAQASASGGRCYGLVAPQIAATLAYEYLEKQQVLLTCSGLHPISDQDWRDYIGYVGEISHLGDRVRVLSWNPTHMPSRAQYDALRKVTRDSQSKVSILATGFAITFIAAALKLTNKNARMFDPGQLISALGHLGLTTGEARVVRDELSRLQRLLEAS
jgi:hypothetical protein